MEVQAVMKFKIELCEGEKVPYGYGISWYEYAIRTAVCFPMPFHILFAYCRRFYFYMMVAFIHTDPIEIEVDNRARKLFAEWKLKELQRIEVDFKDLQFYKGFYCGALRAYSSIHDSVKE